MHVRAYTRHPDILSKSLSVRFISFWVPWHENLEFFFLLKQNLLYAANFYLTYNSSGKKVFRDFWFAKRYKLLRFRSFSVNNTIRSFTRLFDFFNTFFRKDHNTTPLFCESPSKLIFILLVYRIYTRVLI